MLPKNLHRRTMMQRLHIFPEDVSSWRLFHLQLTRLQTPSLNGGKPVSDCSRTSVCRRKNPPKLTQQTHSCLRTPPNTDVCSHLICSHQELPEDIRANLTEELPQPREIPRKLSEYTQEEMDAFPRLWTPYVERDTHTHTLAGVKGMFEL